MASSSRCLVLPGLTGLSSCHNDVCLPEEYEEQIGVLSLSSREVQKQPGTSKVTHENVRALAHGFYAEGADGISFFNFYSKAYQNLYPLPDICLPERIAGKERRYTYLTTPSLYGDYGRRNFLQLILPPGCLARKAVECRLHEDLKQADAYVRFKARHLNDLGSLRVDVNKTEMSPESLSLVPHSGEGFVYAQFQLQDGIIHDGDNEVGFAYRAGSPVFDTDVIIQELEIRVVPRKRS
jgi:hypothetical protein